MVIGHDHVNTERFRMRHDGVGANAGIYADDQPYSAFRRPVNGFDAHSVAVFQPVRHVKLGAAPQQIDGFLEHDNRSGSIDIVIAVKENRLADVDSAKQARYSAIHVAHEKRIVERLKFRKQKLGSGSGVAIPAICQNRRYH